MESTTGLANPPKHGKNGKLSPFSPFPFHPASTGFGAGSGGIPMEEQPLWLDDLLNDSETIPHMGHRRSASESYACLGEAAVALSLDDEPGFVNAYFGSSQNLIPHSIMQAEGGGVSAELEFIEQQNMILTMENRALRQRLESISQEQMIKQCQKSLLSFKFHHHIAFLQKQTDVQNICRGARNVGERNREIAISVSSEQFVHLLLSILSEN